MKEIVVGVDGSARSTTALRWAAELAARSGRRVRAVGSWQYPAGSALPTSDAALDDPEAMDRMVRRTLDRAVGDGVPEGVPVEREVVRGPAPMALLPRAEHPRADLLVVGSRGLGGFSGLLLGSVSRQCLEHAQGPVVVVPDGATPTPPRRVVVGADGSAGSAAALEWASALARAVGAEVVAVHVLPDDRGDVRPDVHDDLVVEAREDLTAWCKPLADAGVPHEALVELGDPRSVLLEVTEAREGDLVVLGARGAGRVRHLLLGSVAAAVTRHSAVPVAVVPLHRAGVAA
jgi:nucleotide-binding universal stress UspA family protein